MIVAADTTPINYLILTDLTHILFTGTIGLLDRAGARGLIDVREAIVRLRETSFRVSPRLLNTLLDRYKLE